MPWIHFDEVGQFLQPRDRGVKQNLGAGDATLGEVGSRDVADHQEIRRQDAPGLRATAGIGDQEVDLLGPMPRNMHDFELYLAQRQAVTIGQPRSLEADLGKLVHDQFAARGCGQAPGAGDVVGVAVGIDDVADRRGLAGRHLHIGSGIPKRIEHGALTGFERTDHIRGAACLFAEEGLEPQMTRSPYQTVVYKPRGDGLGRIVPDPATRGAVGPGILAGNRTSDRIEPVHPRALTTLTTLTGLVALALVAAGVGACSSAAAPQRPVVIIVIDTLRADHMSAYGYARTTTPRLDELARSGSVFEHAFSTAAWTLPGVTSILTGQWPSVHGAGIGRDEGFSRADAAVPALAEVLTPAGYSAGAIVNAGYLHPGFGFDRGFDLYDYASGNDEQIRRADVSVDRALEWVEEHRDEPFFLLFHVFDVHRHYDAPEPVRGTFTDAYRDRYGDSLATLESRIQAERDSDLDFHVAAYDEEILFVDGQIGRLVDGLRDKQVWDDSLVVVTADHGEAFREHGALAHGSSLHNEVMRVPLVVWGPGVPATRWPDPVSTVDIFPTVTQFAAIEAAPAAAGVSLWPLFGGGELPERVLFAENIMYQTNLSAVVSWPLKLIRDFKHNGLLLYDLARDPGETVDLLEGADKATIRLARELRQYARALRDGDAGQAVTLDEDLVKDLRALGYVQ